MRPSDFENCFPVRPEWRICGEAADGIQGVEKAKALRPAIVLLDVSMPRMDGLELTRIRGVQRSPGRFSQPN
jgi:YesN/AraC family two-component response regulator